MLLIHVEVIGSVNYHNLLKVFLDIKSLFFFPNFNTHTHTLVGSE